MSSPQPGLAALRGFEAAARLGSFAAAAQALNVTQSAISHQVRTLESDLRQPLFRRVGRSVVLTDAGRAFAQTTSKVLRTLDAGVQRLAPYANPRSVILYTEAAFARGVLLPRLGEFRVRHPEVDLWIDTSAREVDFAEDEVDLLITRRDPAPGATSVVICRDARVPMASPGLIASCGGVPAKPAGLASWPLLHDESPLDWSHWFKLAGAPASDDALLIGTAFSDPELALAAAAAGQGLVLGSLVAADALIKAGALVPLAMTAVALAPLRLEADPQRLNETAVRATRDWLRSIAPSAAD